MGSTIAVLVAFLATFMNDRIFKQSSANKSGPLVSLCLFVTAICLLLRELPLYPSSMRKLGSLVQCIFEIMVAALITQGITVDFWIPLEAAAMNNLPKLAEAIEDMLSGGEWECKFCQIFRHSTTRIIVSYTLSIFFLMTVLHATRALNFRLFQNGLYCLCNTKTKVADLFKSQSGSVQNNQSSSIPNSGDISSCSSQSDLRPAGKQKRKVILKKRRKSDLCLNLQRDNSDLSLDDDLDTLRRQTRSCTKNLSIHRPCSKATSRKSIF